MFSDITLTLCWPNPHLDTPHSRSPKKYHPNIYPRRKKAKHINDHPRWENKNENHIFLISKFISLSSTPVTLNFFFIWNHIKLHFTKIPNMWSLREDIESLYLGFSSVIVHQDHLQILGLHIQY